MKIFYNGREIPEAYAKMLEAAGQAHLGDVPWVGDGEPRFIMESGPGNSWLEKQPPDKFLMHVFGHTTTWSEMARTWANDGAYGMSVVAECLASLNTIMLAALTERKELALDEADAVASRT